MRTREQVASYGQIAELIGRPTNSRRVGAALKVLSVERGSPYLPQQRRAARTRGRDNPLPNRGQGAGDQGEAGGHRAGDEEGGAEKSDADEEEEEPLPPPEPNPNFVPWHRVLSSTGLISPRGNLHAVLRQADWLRAEGVEVDEGIRNGNDRNAGAGVGAGARGGGVRNIAGVGGGDAFGLGGAEGGRVSMRIYRWDGRF